MVLSARASIFDGSEHYVDDLATNRLESARPKSRNKGDGGISKEIFTKALVAFEEHPVPRRDYSGHASSDSESDDPLNNASG